MATLNPYLNFPGTSEEAFEFYRSVFGGEFTMLQRFKEVPDQNIGEEYKEKIMHIALPIGKNVLMATDAIEGMGHAMTFGTHMYLSLQAESKEEAEKLFNGLSEDGKIEIPLQDMFWGAYFASFTDKFGMGWMINYEYPKN